MANYDLKTFVTNPVKGDVKIKIYDKSSTLKYSVDPRVSVFYKNSNLVIIKSPGIADIVLDFETSAEASSALVRLSGIKQELLDMFSGSITAVNNQITVFSKLNLNMKANVSTFDGALACSTPIREIPAPYSMVKVFINGVEVSVGGKVYPFDCYFSVDGITERILGDERIGDKLYWNKSVSGYKLDETDLIDFVYLVKIIF